MPDTAMPTRRSLQTIEAVREATGGSFDADAWYVMDRRDNTLIENEILNGSGSSTFVYQFEVQGKPVAGISVVGARHLASFYGGIKHRIIATVEKKGEMFVFTSYPAPGSPMAVSCQSLPELAEREIDFFMAVVEVTDVKTGNTIQIEKRESRFEIRRDGTSYERPHFQLIAQSKAYRNATLAIIPQDVQLRFKLDMMRLQKSETITSSVIDEKRAGVLRFATGKGLAIERHQVEALTLDQISGLSDAARAGDEAFKSAAVAAGVLQRQDFAEEPSKRAQPKPTPEVKRQPPQDKRAPGISQAVAGALQEVGGQVIDDMAARDRERVEATLAEANAAAEKMKAEAARLDPTKPIPSDGWVGYLVDGNGDLAGDGQAFTDMISWTRALGRMWQDLPEDSRADLLNANDEWLSEVQAAGGQAASILRDITSLTPGYGAQGAGQGAAPATIAPSQPAIEAVPIAQGRGGWLVYAKAVRDALGQIGRDRLEEWARVNAPFIATAPDSQRLKLIQAVRDHANAVGAASPAAIEALMEAQLEVETEAARAPLTDGDDDWTAMQERDIATFPNKIALDEYSRSGALKARMDRYHRDRPELFERIAAAIGQRRSQLPK